MSRRRPHSCVFSANLVNLVLQNYHCILLLKKKYNKFKRTLSQPNNNHNPNNKTIKTGVGLGPNNRWETTNTHHHTNSKLHDRAEIEQNSENKSH